MGNLNKQNQPAGGAENYDLMVELEQLESLREEMEELGVTTMAEVDRRIVDLHRRLDQSEGA
ncbi:MAG: hypothetical protein ACYC3S_02465 [Chloroflexota bacterium]